MGPIRGEPLGADHLAERARVVARGQQLLPAAPPRILLQKPGGLARLDETRRIVTAARAHLSADPKLEIGPAGEWLLDNFYVIDQHLHEIREGLPKSYYRELPALATGVLAGEPRIFELALTLIAHTEGRVELANLELFIGAAQEVSPLSLGELWALPAMMRLALIENIRRLTLRTVRRLDELEEADDWAARIEAASEKGEHELRHVLGAFVARSEPLTPTFVSRLLHQLRVTSASSPPLAKLERWIAEEQLSAEDASARSSQQLALTQLMMANSITSLVAISRLDWVAFVERQSVVEAALRADPSGFYLRMTAQTRDAYRHQVERIAKRSSLSEAQVAELAVTLAQRALVVAPGLPCAPEPDRRAHVGYFLVDEGRVELEGAASYRAPPRERLHRFLLRHPHTLFVGGIATVTAAGVSALAYPKSQVSLSSVALIALFVLLPVLDLAVNLVNQLITLFVPPRHLPKLKVAATDVAAETATAIAVPVLLADLEAVSGALHNLEVQYLSNPEPYLRFVLLSDFTDAASESEPGDAAIAAAAIQGVRELNERYGSGGKGMFHLLHRARRFDAGEGSWIGWERKRGKLAQLNAFLRDKAGDAFSHVEGDSERLKQTRFVITLDADTMLPAESAAELIGTLAHPLNRPVFDPTTEHVVRGYGVLQPRVVVSLASAQATPFAALHSGRPGMDPYTTAVSDVYQDLYGEGSYSGKGIYDVDAFERATHGRFPEQALLSHDLIEGSFVRAGLVTDVNVYDDYPARYLTFTRRKHRWIRGDWQLLPWLRGRAPGTVGRQDNHLSGLARLKIFDNLRRSVAEIAQLALLLASVALLPGEPVAWTLFASGLIAAPWLVSLLLAAVRPPLDKSWAAYYASLGRDAWLSLQQFVLALVFLPHQVWISADAILRTLWRLGVTRKHLLEWRTAEQWERGASGTVRESLRHMAPATLTAIALLTAAWLCGHAGPLGAFAHALTVLVFLLLWLSAPAVAYLLSRPARPKREHLSHRELATAQRQARLHWEFFERFTTAETAWLTPDNFQDDPAPVVAMRTSPTNIGLQLLATVSAHDLGFISLDQMLTRLCAAFDTLDMLPRHEGHFFNWYSLETLAVLEPAYVSTVDSGNLAGHCIALRQACLALAAAPYNSRFAGALATLAARAYRLCHEMNFGFLYDRERKLFAIGYQPGTRAMDGSYYDLLASESRLASFVAIAKNEVPVEHWFRLGRKLTHEGGDTALVSWSGSMFEYLMPALVMQSFKGTLLDQTHRGAVRRQIAYGRARRVPWGVSESAYNVRDRHQTYQYRAFGVPDLALKRGLARDLVIAPYASVLAILVEPKRAIANIERLETLGMGGPYGLRDAIDYTRPNPGKDHALVSTYMAHHIGMGLVALTNALADNLWQKRFHADPLVQSAELLLQERIPRRIAFLAPPPTETEETVARANSEALGERYFEDVDTSEPHVALLGQLPYTLMISHCGAGYSRFADLAVTRFRADGTSDDTGQFCYLKDVTRDRLWSSAHQPVRARADYYRAVLAPHRVTFRRLDDLIETQTEIAVVPEDAAEVRRITVTNRSDERRILELTSYGEIVLAPPDADRAHPAFSNLFVETEWHAWCSAITATRRPRSAKDRSLVCVHLVDSDATRVRTVSCETDRARFLGRGRSLQRPAALDVEGPLSGSTGAVLDPIFALRVRVELEPGESAQVAFTTLVAPTREAAFVLADRYHHPQAAQRALDLAWTATQVELQELQVSQADAGVFQELAGALLYATPALRAPADELSRNQGSQPMLWEQGISGDWPILLATIDAQGGLKTLRELFAAHHYWRRRGMVVDMVVLNLQPSLYLQELTNEITAGLFGSSDSGMLDRPGGVFMRRRDLLKPETLLMLRATARVHVHCDGQSLDRMVSRWASKDAKTPRVALAAPPRDPQQMKRKGRSAIGAAIEDLAERARETLREPQSAPAATTKRVNHESQTEGPALRFDNGFGGLTAAGAYRIRVEAGTLPPAPWANVVANPHGGFVVSEQGGGFCWAQSSYFFRLTPWRNDPVGDAPGDMLYLRDESTRDVWSATPLPVPGDGPYVVEHDAGSTSFAHEHNGIATHLTLGLAEHSAIKISRLRVENRGDRPRRISITAYVEWTLGVLREHTQHQVHTRFDASARAIFARNFFSPQYAGWVAFCATTGEVTSHSAARRSFLGRNGTLAMPAGLLVPQLDGVTGAGIDPCAALQHVLSLAPGETRELSILLGAAPSEAEARGAIAAYASKETASAALQQSSETWSARLSVITVRTPDPAFDAMINHWTLYQALACRMWARSALYQSSGAYGFRDQLQDVMAFVYAEPALAHEHILRAAARQFVEGDVQHWWHDGTGQGVRTRFSDDLAWLPYVVAHYLRTTGDLAILDEQVPFLTMRALNADEHEIYAEPHVSAERASLREHCLRALHKACTEGPHGLPLMGTGDWNDGMSLVGAGGTGESVWLAWFLVSALRAFEPYERARDAASADALGRTADSYVAAANTHGWDGAWYRRAYFDDGSPLGSAESDECRIDSIAQSWSVISGGGTAERQAQALCAFEQHLVDEQARIVLLLTPPFDKTARDPGYIKGYLPGVRENGAQYTHAALWSVLAYALRGDGDRAFQLYQMLNPLTHTRTPEEVAVYKVEPYVVAADVYSAPGQRGRGGWTWYTGSASWMYRVGLEAMLGFDKRGDTLHIKPAVPAAWPGFSIEYRHGQALYTIEVITSSTGVAETLLDGVKVEGGGIPLRDAPARHHVVVSILPRRSA